MTFDFIVEPRFEPRDIERAAFTLARTSKSGRRMERAIDFLLRAHERQALPRFAIRALTLAALDSRKYLDPWLRVRMVKPASAAHDPEVDILAIALIQLQKPLIYAIDAAATILSGPPRRRISIPLTIDLARHIARSGRREGPAFQLLYASIPIELRKMMMTRICRPR